MRIYKDYRLKLIKGLKKFYEKFPGEKWTVFDLMRFIKQRLNNNRDCWVAVSGSTGSGKSYLTIMGSILLGRPFDLVKNISYIPKGTEIADRLQEMKKQAYIVDEAIRAARKTDWMKKSQKKVIEKIFTERYLNNLCFLLMPNFKEFSKSLKEGAVPFRLVVLYRTKQYAHVFVYKISDNWRSEDPWSDDIANKVYKKKEEKDILDYNTMSKIEKNLPSYLMDFKIPNLALILPDVVEEYERLKIDSRKQSEDDEEDAPDKYKVKYNDVLGKIVELIRSNSFNLGKVDSHKISFASIARELGVSSNVISKSFKEYKGKE